MRFGLGPFGAETSGRDGAAAYEEVLATAELGESRGFDSVWVAERHFAADGYCPSPFVLAAALAARTRALRIGVIATLGLVHPLYVAEDAVVADNASNGRLVLAPANAAPHELAGYGVARDEYDARFEEALEVVLAALAPNPFRHEGRFWRIPANMPEHGEAATNELLSATPKPAQLELPVWPAGFHEPGVRAAARLNAPLLVGPVPDLAGLRSTYAAYDAARPAGARRPLRVAIREVYVADTAERAREECGPYVTAQYERYARWGLFGGATGDFEALARDRFLVGDAETVIAELKRLQQELGLEYLICRFRFPGMPLELVHGAIVRFSREVIPEFRMHALPTQIRTGV